MDQFKTESSCFISLVCFLTCKFLEQIKFAPTIDAAHWISTEMSDTIRTVRSSWFNATSHPYSLFALQKAHEVEVQQGSRGNPDYMERVKLLEKEVTFYKEESGKAQTEVERLLDILRDVETEKNDKDKKIAELER